jgi:hypothetical protein
LNEKKVACGTSEGPIVLFNWDWYGDFKDRIMGHPGSVNCMAKYNENTLITGCEDGKIRVVSISPKGINQLISDKKKLNLDNLAFNDISSIAISNDKLAVCSNINYIKIYDVSNIIKTVEEFEDASESDDKEVDNEEAESGENEDDAGEIEEGEDFEDDEDFEDEESGFSKSLNSKESVEEEKDNEDKDDKEQDDKEQDESEQDDLDESSFSSSSGKKKKKNNSLKMKALGSKRDSEWMIEIERKKQFFSDL